MSGNVESITRATFSTRFGTLMTLIGVAVGLGNVWRFPYMVGQFGGAAFVLLYLLMVIGIGIPALTAELALGRYTRRGPVGAFAAGGLPGGRAIGWFFFAIVTAATSYYAAVIGWVLYYALSEVADTVGVSMRAAAILPPDRGVDLRSLGLQLICTGTVIVACGVVVARGLKEGIERASRWIMPTLFVILLVLVVRGLTLPGSMAGLEWYVLKFRLSDITAQVVMAALGQAVFSMSLGGTFMVVYGSYLGERDNLRSTAVATAFGDTSAGLLAGLAIFPAVFALGLEPASGPGLLFNTLPEVFTRIPGGSLFGLLFFLGLAGAAYLSEVAAFEVLVAGITDNTAWSRRRAVVAMAITTFVLSIPPSLNNAIFVPWDLTFGSGMQTLGALLAVLTIGWCVQRGRALAALTSDGAHPVPSWMIHWIRYGIPAAIITVGVWWLLSSVLGVASAV